MKISFFLFFALFSIGVCGQSFSRRALLVIDVQENLVNPDCRIHIDTTNIDIFFSNINYAITKFNHEGSPVIYIVNEWTNPFMNLLTGNVCKKGGVGVGLDGRLVMVTDLIYSKSESNALSNSGLLQYLKEKNILDVYVVGLLAEGCVKATVNGLSEKNFIPVVLRDALGSKSARKKSKALQLMKKNKVLVIDSKDI